MPQGPAPQGDRPLQASPVARDQSSSESLSDDELDELFDEEFEELFDDELELEFEELLDEEFELELEELFEFELELEFELEPPQPPSSPRFCLRNLNFTGATSSGAAIACASQRLNPFPLPASSACAAGTRAVAVRSVATKTVLNDFILLSCVLWVVLPTHRQRAVGTFIPASEQSAPMVRAMRPYP